MESSRALLSVISGTRTHRGHGGSKEHRDVQVRAKELFRAVVELHLTYAMRGDEDRTGVMTIDEAVAWVEEEMTAAPTPDGRGTSQPE